MALPLRELTPQPPPNHHPKWLLVRLVQHLDFETAASLIQERFFVLFAPFDEGECLKSSLPPSNDSRWLPTAPAHI